MLFGLGFGSGAEYEKKDRRSMIIISIAAALIYGVVYFVLKSSVHHGSSIH